MLNLSRHTSVNTSKKLKLKLLSLLICTAFIAVVILPSTVTAQEYWPEVCCVHLTRGGYGMEWTDYDEGTAVGCSAMFDWGGPAFYDESLQYRRMMADGGHPEASDYVNGYMLCYQWLGAPANINIWPTEKGGIYGWEGPTLEDAIQNGYYRYNTYWEQNWQTYIPYPDGYVYLPWPPSPVMYFACESWFYDDWSGGQWWDCISCIQYG